MNTKQICSVYNIRYTAQAKIFKVLKINKCSCQDIRGKKETFVMTTSLLPAKSETFEE